MTIDQTDQARLCTCPVAGIPHRHPSAAAFEAMRNARTQAPAEERIPLGVAVLPSFADASGDGFLPPRPPAQIPQQDTRPLNLIQVTRREALKLALQYYRPTDEFDDIDVIETADRFTDFIRSGVVPTREKED